MTIQELKIIKYWERKILKGSKQEANIGDTEGGLISREFYTSGMIMPVPFMRIYYAPKQTYS